MKYYKKCITKKVLNNDEEIQPIEEGWVVCGIKLKFVLCLWNIFKSRRGGNPWFLLGSPIRRTTAAVSSSKRAEEATTVKSEKTEAANTVTKEKQTMRDSPTSSQAHSDPLKQSNSLSDDKREYRIYKLSSVSEK